MTVKDRLLTALEEHRGDFLSGETLAEALSVSRSAVWKAVKTLTAQGYPIQAVPNRGYRLAVESHLLSPQSLLRYLKAPLLPEVYPSLPSTNQSLKERAEAGAPEGTVIFAETQTQGRGRRGRAFHSPLGGGIYMSLLLRPQFSAREALFITTCGAVAVCRGVEALTGEPASIKWVNDVFCRGLKVCGIATEASMDLESGGLSYAILGIGLNLYPGEAAFPPELAGIAGTVLSEHPQDGSLRARLAARILDEFWAMYPTITQGGFWAEYRARSFLLGQAVHVLRGEEKKKAVVLDLLPDFSLLVQYEDGAQEALSSGEVSVRGGG